MQIKYKTISDLIANTPNTFKNCKANDKDLNDMIQWLALLSGFVHTRGTDSTASERVEKRLNISLPVEITLFYQHFGHCISELNHEALKQQKFQVLAFEHCWVEKEVMINDYYTGECWFTTDVLVYATAKNNKIPVYGIDLKNGWSLSYEKEWFWQKDGMPLFQKLTTLLANIIIANKAYIIKTKVKGITGIKRDEKVENRFEGTFMRLLDFEYYEHTIFYNQSLDLIGWFRAGNTPDFLVGSGSEDNLKSLITQFDLSSAKFLKTLHEQK